MYIYVYSNIFAFQVEEINKSVPAKSGNLPQICFQVKALIEEINCRYVEKL